MKRNTSGSISSNQMVVVDEDDLVLQQANSDDTDTALQNSTANNNNNTTTTMVNDSLNSFAACFCCNPFETVLPDFVSLQGQAFDGILVTSARTGRVAASDVLINFDHPTSPFPPNAPNVYATTTNTNTTSSSSSAALNRSTSDLAEGDCQALLEIDDPTLGKVYFPVVHDAIRKKNRLGGRPSPKCDCMYDRRNSGDNDGSSSPQQQQQQQQQQHKRTCSSSSNTSSNNSNPAAAESNNDDEQEALLQLATLLQPGKNRVRYLFRNHQRVLGAVQASIFLWSDRDRIVVCDVDGTITKTNVRGIYDTIVTEKYGYCHDRVCQFMSSLKGHSQQQQTQIEQEETGAVNVLYLTSRPLFIAQTTRRFLSNLTQSKANNNPSPSKTKQQQQQQHYNTDQEQSHRLPEGPLMGFAGRFLEVMKMELMTKTVHLFKASLLMDQVVTPFCDVSEDPHEKHQSLFVAGFGNTLMDVQAYHMAGMELSQIYFIDKKSKIACFDGEKQEGSPSKRPSFRRASSSSRTTSSSSLSSGSSPTASGSFKVPKDILDPEATNTFLLVDGAQPTAVTNNRPCLKTPLPRKSYKQQMGTAFEGYHDERLASHVLDTDISV